MERQVLNMNRMQRCLLAIFVSGATADDVDFKRQGANANIISYEMLPGSYHLEAIEPYTMRYLKLTCRQLERPVWLPASLYRLDRDMVGLESHILHVIGKDTLSRREVRQRVFSPHTFHGDEGDRQAIVLFTSKDPGLSADASRETPGIFGKCRSGYSQK